MCGILGYIGKPLKEEGVDQIMGSLGHLENRGDDSFGLLVAKDDAVKIYRWTKAFSKVADQVRPLLGEANLVLGHTRMATVGSISVRNCHPIVEGKAIVVHNGSVSSYKEIITDEEDAVDSRAIARILEDGELDISRLKDLGWSGVFLAISLKYPDRLLLASRTIGVDIFYIRTGLLVVSERCGEAKYIPMKFGDISLWRETCPSANVKPGKSYLIFRKGAKDLGKTPYREYSVVSNYHLPLAKYTPSDFELCDMCFKPATKRAEGMALCQMHYDAFLGEEGYHDLRQGV